MRKLLIVLLFLFVIFCVGSFFVVRAVQQEMNELQIITADYMQVFSGSSVRVDQTAERLSRFLKKWNAYLQILLQNKRVFVLTQKIHPSFSYDNALFLHRASTLGLQIIEKKTMRILVLFQNNFELRPTGGFLGSYAMVDLERGVVRNIRVQDIYAPDGQVEGYIEAPPPVKEYLFQSGGWKLRDANWDPNFPDSAKTIAWFFEKGGYDSIDAVVAINFSFVQDVLRAIGPVELPDYHLTVDENSIYQFAQVQAEKDFFPGATHKSDALGAVTRAMIRKSESLRITQLIKLLDVVQRSVNDRTIQVWFTDDALQKFSEQYRWSGALQPESETCKVEECYQDFIAFVEANVGINKADCCIDRSVSHTIFLSENAVRHAIRFTVTNNNPENPLPPVHYGGRYKDYMRVYGRFSEPPSISVEGKPVSCAEFSKLHTSLSVCGFLLEVGGGESREIVFDWTQDSVPSNFEYTARIRKQPGVPNYPYTVRIEKNGLLEYNQTLDFDLMITETPDKGK